MRKIGLTGSRHENPSEFRQKLKDKLRAECKKGPIEAHHGDCDGSDKDFHFACLELRDDEYLSIRIIVHPPIRRNLRVFCDSADEYRKKKNYKERDRDIVDEVDELWAHPAPDSVGTVYTMKYAEQQGKKVIRL